MRANKNSTDMPISWTYGIIWSVIMVVLSVLVRHFLWYKLVWAGDPYVFIDEFCYNSKWMLYVGAGVVVCTYLFSYWRYKKLAAKNIMDLHGVCHDKYGRVWVLPLLLTFVLEVLWCVVCMALLIGGCDLDIVNNRNDMTVIQTFTLISGICLAVDVLLFAAGNAVFKPKEVMEKK